ncbi:dihydroneopterin aldolase [Rhizobium sp. BK196]|jgi:7,8-dihydroneopterin aldolase/epimerase/oxygenase|uniref:dihydroneopterin aldolase n=1 Tax=Rhizobium sp. BK196 TaxID=2587073 RepID=UPI00160EF3F8|nr:dihydroneopterin aldolase [Rhizobium sp. BK196]MBB3311908.1 dihydroneopterin aldolase [Rhizobium sp. BK196]
MSTYTILMQNCAFFARHGVHAEEEFLGQRFFVDAELEVEAGGALENDSIDETVHYGTAFTIIEGIVVGQRRYLIEALALDIAKGLSNKFPQIIRAKITVRKPNAPIPGVLDFVQVTVEHRAR